MKLISCSFHFSGFELCWRGSFGQVPQRFLSSRDIWDWLIIPSEHHDIWFSVRLTIWKLYLATIIMHHLVKLFPQVNSTLETQPHTHTEKGLWVGKIQPVTCGNQWVLERYRTIRLRQKNKLSQSVCLVTTTCPPRTHRTCRPRNIKHIMHHT